jgi:hypothetical protein
LPWWQRRTAMDDGSARHKFLEGWNHSFTSCEVLCAKLVDKRTLLIWWPYV